MTTDYKKYILSNGTHYISNSGNDEIVVIIGKQQVKRGEPE